MRGRRQSNRLAGRALHPADAGGLPAKWEKRVIRSTPSVDRYPHSDPHGFLFPFHSYSALQFLCSLHWRMNPDPTTGWGKINPTTKIRFCSYLFARCSKSSLTCFVRLLYRKMTRLWLQHCSHSTPGNTIFVGWQVQGKAGGDNSQQTPSQHPRDGSCHKGPEFWMLSLKFWMLCCFSPYTNPNLNFAMIFWGIL